MRPPSLTPSSEVSDLGADEAEELSDTAAAALPDGAETQPKSRRRRWWMWGLGVVLLAGVVLGALFIPTPYVLIQPGAVRPADDRVSVQGVPSYEDDGDVMFTTVYVDQATLFGLLRGSVDDAIEVRTQDEVYGDRGRDETREINRHQMDLSKLLATRVALEHLGYDARISAEGAFVVDVAQDVPAASVIESGDVIVALNGQEVSVPADLRAALEPFGEGDEVTVSVQRAASPTGESAGAEPGDTEVLELRTTLELSQDAARAVLGVSVEPWNPKVESEVIVDIDSGTVTGPSAGLAWSLAVLDALTPESLTDGRDVAVTGEILGDGSVGVIGGIAQKVSTVVRNDVDVFIYPADTPSEEQDEMRQIAGDDLELVPVATLAEAVEFLAPGLGG